jgi:hypothetical protein
MNDISNTSYSNETRRIVSIDSPGIWMIHTVEEMKLLLLYNLLYI